MEGAEELAKVVVLGAQCEDLPLNEGAAHIVVLKNHVLPEALHGEVVFGA